MAAAATAFADSAKPIGIVDIDADRNVTSLQVNASTPELASLARLAFGEFEPFGADQQGG